MEAKWPSGFLRDSTAKMAAIYLASSTNILSDALIRCLGNELLVNQKELASELSYTPQTSEGLYNWCKSPGSTIFVLVSVLSQVGRSDCVRQIEQYLQMHTMQLFIKLEQASTHGSPCASSPQFYQVTTSCEFSLVQALKNILGGDLVRYEIIGPGSWVTWTTLTQELKGQQLTLLHHHEPVAHTQAAMYGNSDIGVKQPLITNNIPVNCDITIDEETGLKVFDHTQIDSLKYSLDSPDPGTDSNNVTSPNSVDFEYMPEEDGLAKTNTFPSLYNQDYKSTLDSQIPMKASAAYRDNTTKGSLVMKAFPDKEINSMSDNHSGMVKELNPLQVLNNVPQLSIPGQDQSINAQRFTSQTAQNSMTQNLSSQTFQTMTSQASQNLSPKSECIKIQNTLNNLSCRTTTSSPNTSFFPNSMDSKIVQKSTTDITSFQGRPNNRPSQTETVVENCFHGDGSISPFYGENMVVSDSELEASSLFTQSGQDQQINIPLCAHSGDYVSHACIQNIRGDVHSYLDCAAVSMGHQNSGFIVTPPQKRHRLDGVTTPLASPEQETHHHHKLQPQILLERNMLELNQLQQAKSVIASHDNHVNKINQHNDQQHLWNVQTIISPANELQYQTVYHRQSSSCELGQSPSHQQSNSKSQSFPLQRLSHQQCQQSSRYDTQLVNKQLPTCHTLRQQPSDEITEQNCQRLSGFRQTQLQQSHPMGTSLRQQFSDEITEQSCHPLSGFRQTRLQESHPLNTSLSQQGKTAFQLEELQNNIISTSIRDEQHMTALRPQPIDNEQPRDFSPFIRQQHLGTVHQTTGTPLPNFEFTVRLPQSNSNAKSNTPQVVINSVNKCNTGSCSFGNSVGRSATFPANEATLFNNGATFHNNGATFHNSGATVHNSGATFHNNGATFHNDGATVHNSGATFPTSSATFHNNGALFHNDGATFHNSGATFPSSFAILSNSNTTHPSGEFILIHRGEQFPAMAIAPHQIFTSHADLQFNQTTPSRKNSSDTQRKHSSDTQRKNYSDTQRTNSSDTQRKNSSDTQRNNSSDTLRKNSSDTLRQEFLHEDIIVDEEGYNYIDKGHCSGEKSRHVSRWPSPATPKRDKLSLADELLCIEGWCPQENGDTIQNTMKTYRSQDGSYIVWKSRRHEKFVITVSHLKKLFHFRVEETQHETKDRIVYYLFEGGFRSESLLDLLQHYRQNSIRTSMQSTSGPKTYIEHIKLRYPIKPGTKRKGTSRST